jgi:hypothetical protein
MLAQRCDDPVELSRRSQLGGLAEAGNELVADLAALTISLDQREVLIDTIAPTHRRRLHVHINDSNPNGQL